MSWGYESSIPAWGALLCMDYRVSESMGIGVDLCYLGMKADRVEAVKDLDIDGDGTADVKKGDAIQDENGKDVPLDLSGVQLSVALNLLF
jgi:hypothetical protein